MMVKLSSLYSDSAWDAQEKPRKFFIKHRGFGPTHGRGDLPHHRRMFLRCALASAERASELAPSSLECATLRACILSLVIADAGAGRDDSCADGGAGPADAQLSRACAACRHAMRLHERWLGDGSDGAAAREDFEIGILHAPGERPGEGGAEREAPTVSDGVARGRSPVIALGGSSRCGRWPRTPRTRSRTGGAGGTSRRRG